MKFANLAGMASLVITGFVAAPQVAFAQQAGTVKIGKEIKKTTGVVKELQNADIACNMVMLDDQGEKFFESADFEICFQKPSLIAKRVSLKYKMANVMAASCQGDLNCKKSDQIALVVEAKIIGAGADTKAGPKIPAATAATAPQASFCTQMEEVVFACRTGAKLVSVCASKGAMRTQGYVQYRFGKPDSREPLEIVLPVDQPLIAKTARGTNIPFAGGGGAWMRFNNAPFAYVVYTGIGKWGPKGETAEKQGVVVERGGKAIANLKCNREADSLLGSDWFEKVGIQGNGDEFQFPD